MYYHEGPKPHLHPYPYHIDGEPPAAKVHRDVRPIPITKRRKRRRIGRRRKRHGKHSVLQIPVTHHHHPPDVITEPPIYQSALRNLLATPVPSLAGNAPVRRRSSPLIVAPVIRQAAAPKVKWRPTILQPARASQPVVRRASNLRSPTFNSIIHRPILTGPSLGSGARIDRSPIILDDNPFSQSSHMVDKRPLLQSSFLKQKPFIGSSMMSSDSSFDHLPIIEDDGPIIYETGGPMESSFFEDGPPILLSSIKEEHPFRKSSIRRSEPIIDSHSGDEILMESPFLGEKPSGSSFIMDHKPQERPPFLEDEGPTIFRSSKIKDSNIFMESPMEDQPLFTSDHMFSKNSYLSAGGEIMDASEEYKQFKEYKLPIRKSSIIKDEDFMEYITGEKPPTDGEIMLDDSTFIESSIIRDKPFTENTNDDELYESMGKSPPIIRDAEQMESLFENEPVEDDKIHFMDDEDVPFKRSVKKDYKKSSQNSRSGVHNSESRKNGIMSKYLAENGLFVKSSFQKDKFEHIPFDMSKTEFLKSSSKEYGHHSPSRDNPMPIKSHKMYDHASLDKGTKFISKSSHEFVDNDPIIKDQEQSTLKVLDKKDDYISFHKEIKHQSERSSREIMPKEIFFYMDENLKKPWDTESNKEVLLTEKSFEKLDNAPESVRKHPRSKPTDMKRDHMLLVEGIENTSKERHQDNFDRSNLKSSRLIFEHHPAKGLVPISKSSNEVMDYASSTNGHSDIHLSSKYAEKHILHHTLEKDSKNFFEQFPHRVSDFENPKSSDKIYDYIPFEEDVTSIGKPPHGSFKILPYHITEEYGGSLTNFFDHIPFEKEEIVTKLSHEGSEHTPYNEVNGTVRKYSEEFLDHDPTDEGKERRTKASYKIFKHIPVVNNKDSAVKTSSTGNIGNSNRKTLKLTRIKDNNLQIPLIADLPKPFNINKISVSSVSDSIFQQSPANVQDENSMNQNMNFKNVDFQDVKLLTSNTGGSNEVRVHYFPERD